MDVIATLLGYGKFGLVAVLVAGILWALPYGIKWLKAKANTNKLLEATAIDEAIIDALSLTVSNVGEKFLADISKTGKSPTKEQLAEARDKAVEGAKTILKDQGIDLLKNRSVETVHEIIRYIVDKNGESADEK